MSALDGFTVALRVVAFAGLGAALTYLSVWAVQAQWHRRRDRRPYDWALDGECDNHSHPRVIE